jgi:predicted 2-oxoglutarate/Fe(II)-dependent dioxygenase YbiX
MAFKKTTLAPGIVSYYDVIDDPKGLISKIEELANANELEWKSGEVRNQGEGPEVKSRVDVKARVVDTIGLAEYDRKPISNRPASELTMHLTLNEKILPVVKDYAEEYRCLPHITGENWQILRYGSGHYFIDHIDDSKLYPRTCSISYYLNDEYEGGEIEFSRFGLKIKPVANQAIVFPANYVYNHTVHPVTSGTRWTIVNWFE